MDEVSAGELQHETKTPWSWGCLTLLALLAVAGAPLLLVRAGAPFHAVLLGAGAWAAAVLVKWPLGRAVNLLAGRVGGAYVAAAQGALSAALELTAAGIVLRSWRGAALADVVAFGAGAGSAEVVYVLILGAVTKRDPEVLAAWARAAAHSLCVRYATPIERFFALLGHVGSRGLVYVGLHGRPSLLVVAFALFTAVDAVATYSHLQGWDWNDAATCRRGHGLFAAIAIVETALFALAFRG